MVLPNLINGITRLNLRLFTVFSDTPKISATSAVFRYCFLSDFETSDLFKSFLISAIRSNLNSLKSSVVIVYSGQTEPPIPVETEPLCFVI
jgi:hypothetical protein